MAPIRVLIHGALGRMGQQTLVGLCEAPDTEPVAGVDINAASGRLSLPGDGHIPLSDDLASALASARPQVVVDFTNAEASASAARVTLDAGVNFVTGSSGLPDADLQDMDRRAKSAGVGVVVAPNFALGAVLLVSLVAKAAPYFDYVDIIEAHHEQKIDAPSGTALAIARAAAASKGGEFVRKLPQKENLPGAAGSGYRGVGIHSLRQPGRSAHHTVVFGAQGQTLTISHDTLDRGCYMPGILAAVREVVNLKGLVLGLDKILNV